MFFLKKCLFKVMEFFSYETVWNIGFIFLIPIIFLLRIIIYTGKNTIAIFKNKNLKLTEKTLSTQLSENYKKEGGYMAGSGHYANVWTRDSFFALMAPIPEKEERLRLFANRLKTNINLEGQIPFTFNKVYYLPSIIFNTQIKRNGVLVSYKDEKYGKKVMDANAQYIIITHEAFLINQNKEWLQSHFEVLEKSINWYNNHLKNGLIYEEAFGSWEDTLLHNGNIAFTNVLYLESLKRMDLICKTLEKPSNYLETYQQKYEKIFQLVKDQQDTVSVSLMAIWTSDEKITDIMKEMLKRYPKQMVPNRWPVMETSKTMLAVRIIGQGHYHRNWRWSWVGCLWCYALAKRGFIQESKGIFKKYQNAFQTYGTIHEVYDPETEKPINISFYSSEKSFSEGIGMYLLAEKTLKESEV